MGREAHNQSLDAMEEGPITEDYYEILSSKQSDDIKAIKRTYDDARFRPNLVCPGHDASPKVPHRSPTCTIPKIRRAYKFLKDESQRRAYDLIYPSIANVPIKAPRDDSTLLLEAFKDKEQLQLAEKLLKMAKWRGKLDAQQDSIIGVVSKLKDDIRKVELDIEKLDANPITDSNNGWGAWMLSFVWKGVEETEEEKLARVRAEEYRRSIMRRAAENKRRELATQLEEEEYSLLAVREQAEILGTVEYEEARSIQNRIFVTEKERQVKYDAERELEDRRKWEEHTAAERARNVLRYRHHNYMEGPLDGAGPFEYQGARAVQGDIYSREIERQERYQMEHQRMLQEQQRQWENSQAAMQQYDAADYNAPTSSLDNNRPSVDPSTCWHNEWWTEVHGPQHCPHCNDYWNYLLACPRCGTMACPRCQANLWSLTQNVRIHDTYRAPSPDWS